MVGGSDVAAQNDKDAVRAVSAAAYAAADQALLSSKQRKACEVCPFTQR
jgi:hypothetical protein